MNPELHIYVIHMLFVCKTKRLNFEES